MSDRQIFEEKEQIASAKKTLKRERIREKLRRRLTNEQDIKYLGPLSYRYLRIIAWLAFIVGQVALISMLTDKFTGFNFLGDFGQKAFSFVSGLSTPLFVIASFGMVLNHRKSFLNLLLTYGAAFLGIGLGMTVFYYRYISGLFIKLGAPPIVLEIVTPFLGAKSEINVFADLFSFLLFNFFISYTPRVLENKNILWFRFLSIVPVLFVVSSYVLRVLGSMDILHLPYFVYPFLTTKPPLVFVIFAIVTLWIKNRERLFLSLGANKEEYQKFLLTRRNSLSFSIKLSVLITIFSIIDLLVYFIVAMISSSAGATTEEAVAFTQVFGIGQCAALLLAVPFILLYSYTKNHKNTLIDIFIPVGGIALTAIVYIESIYQLITNLVNA